MYLFKLPNVFVQIPKYISALQLQKQLIFGGTLKSLLHHTKPREAGKAAFEKGFPLEHANEIRSE